MSCSSSSFACSTRPALPRGFLEIMFSTHLLAKNFSKDPHKFHLSLILLLTTMSHNMLSTKLKVASTQNSLYFHDTKLAKFYCFDEEVDKFVNGFELLDCELKFSVDSKEL